MRIDANKEKVIYAKEANVIFQNAFLLDKSNNGLCLRDYDWFLVTAGCTD